MSRTVEKNLLAIIDGLTAAEGCCAGGATSCACTQEDGPHTN